MIPATIFLSAFLLFLVQPIIAKLILPQFGGGVAVWATCLVFFQLALLLGYAYAHQVVQRDRSGRLRQMHIAALLLSLLVLPIIPGDAWPSLSGAGPSAQIVALLLATIGLPFALLATTSPLLQAWLAREGSARDPYRLFVVSNLASLFALVSYPWLIEPWLGTTMQARVWSVLYAAYVVLAVAVASTRGRRALRPQVPPASEPMAAAAPEGLRALGLRRPLGWMALAALASYELVAVTNHLTQNVPSMPMMWVLPLGAYLLTFTLCFDGDRWYRPAAFRAATLAMVLAMCWMLYDIAQVHRLALQVGVFVGGLFVVCMFCHGELARDRPPPLQLTQFYLCVAAGGALGGAAVGLAAPALLPGYFEVEIGLVLVTIAVMWRSFRRSIAWVVAGATATVAATATAAYRIEDATARVVSMSRNFYGVVRVREQRDAGDPNAVERTLVHGSILHGQQYMGSETRRRPTTYYVESSGIGRLLRAISDRPREVGVVGLGTGTIAAYGRPGDRYHFFEIDPAVVAVAQRYFTFLSDSPAAVQVHVGDGRLLLRNKQAQRFDVLAVDAFSGDSIPVHLLTREAVALYLERLKPGGVIALHVSNRYLDLRPVVGRIAAEMGLQSAYVEDEIAEHDGPEKSSSDWILLAREREVLDAATIQEATRDLPEARPKKAWTDDYSNIAQVMALTKPIAN